MAFSFNSLNSNILSFNPNFNLNGSFPVRQLPPVNNNPAPVLYTEENKLQQLKEFRQLINDSSQSHQTLYAKYEDFDASIKAVLTELVWIGHYKPTVPDFGTNTLREDTRVLLRMKNDQQIDIISQLISYYENKIEASRLSNEIRNFIQQASRLAGDQTRLRQLFNGLNERAREDLYHKVWYNHGGKNNPNFGGWNYGANQIQSNPYCLWEKFDNSSSDVLITVYLNELDAKKDCSDRHLLNSLGTKYNLNQVFDTSTKALERKENLIASLPENLRTAFVTAELNGVASLGGLGAALDGMVRGFGVDDSRVIMPLYENGPIKDSIMNNLVETDYKITVDGKERTVLKPNRKTRKEVLNGIHVYFIADRSLFWVEKKIDGTSGNFYEGSYENARYRWAIFNKAAAELCYQFSKKTNPFELVHVQDAQTALVPSFLKNDHLDEWKRGETPATVFTYHNNQETMEYGSEQTYGHLASLGLPNKPLNAFIEGLRTADTITTVSPQFAKESQYDHSDFGKGMQRDVRKAAKEGKLFGITNGNTNNWDPSKSKQLKEWVSVLPETQGRKPDLQFGPRMNDRELVTTIKTIQKELCTYLKQLPSTNPAYADLDPEKPIFFYVGRYDSSQKGVEKLKLIMEEILAQGGQFICVGVEPDPVAKETLNEMRKIAEQRNKKGVLILEDHKENGVFIYQGVFGDLLRAACTCAVFPSKFEPCGLVQGELLKYGKKVVATQTGGFINTLQTEGSDANAYLFERKSHWGSKYNPSHEQNEAIKSTLKIALVEAHRQQRAFYQGSEQDVVKYARQMRKIMQDASNSTWEKTPDGSLSPTRLYELVYAEAFKRREDRGRVSVDLLNVKV